MKMKPILDKFEIKGIQNISTHENRVLIEHCIPGMGGSLFQDLGTEPTKITLRGSLSYSESRQDVLNLEKLREKFQAAQPVPFVADITTATSIKEVLIKSIEIRESEKWPDCFDFLISLKEHVPEPPQSNVQNDVNNEAEEKHEKKVKQVIEGEGSLIVRVDLEDGTTDYTKISVLVEGTTEDGQEFSVTIDNEVEGIYTVENLPAGAYTVSIQSGVE